MLYGRHSDPGPNTSPALLYKHALDFLHTIGSLLYTFEGSFVALFIYTTFLIIFIPMDPSDTSAPQPTTQHDADPFIEYSRALHQYTLRLWTESRRIAEERTRAEAEKAKADQEKARKGTEEEKAAVDSPKKNS